MVDAFSNQFQNFMTELSSIASKGNFAVQPKLNPVKPQTINMSMPKLPYSNPGSSGGSSGGGGPVGASELDRLMRAIRGKESGGNYGAINPHSGALGAYQVMLSNLSVNNGSDWDRQALGRDVTREEYLKSPQIQDAIARYKLGEYLRKYGAAGAAATWYGGDWGRKNMHSKSTQAGGYPSMYAYYTAILNSM